MKALLFDQLLVVLADLLVVEVQGLDLLRQPRNLNFESGLSRLFGLFFLGNFAELLLKLVDFGPPSGHFLRRIRLSIFITSNILFLDDLIQSLNLTLVDSQLIGQLYYLRLTALKFLFQGLNYR
jgi:hypothetical protein